MPHDHAPARARALLREAKRPGGRAPVVLLKDAARIDDPYHAAVAVFGIADDRRVDATAAARALTQAADLVRRVDQAWRRAEVVAELLKKTRTWRERDQTAATQDARARFQAACARTVLELPAGEGLSQAVEAVARHLPRGDLKGLAERALANTGFELNDGRAIAKAWAAGGSAADADGFRALVATVPDGMVRAKLLAYYRHQAGSRLPSEARAALWADAIAAANGVADDEARGEAVRYLARMAEASRDVTAVSAALPITAPPAWRANMRAALAARADRLRDRPQALELIREAIADAERVEEAAVRVRVQAKLAETSLRAGDNATARVLIDVAAGTVADGAATAAAGRVRAAVGKLAGLGLDVAAALAALDTVSTEPGDAEPPRDGAPPAAVEAPRDAEAEATAPAEVLAPRAPPTPTPPPAPLAPTFRPRVPGAPAPASEPAREATTPAAAPSAAPASRRHILALADTYEGGLKSTHLRALARAAPLCVAFDLDLALVGWPVKDLDELVAAAAKETNVSGGKHVAGLARDGRVHLVAADGQAVPEALDALACVVVTTERPDEAKRATLDAALKQAGTGRVCLVMGLGKRGLPPTWLRACPLHYEITGANVGFETATAMGVLAERLRALGKSG